MQSLADLNKLPADAVVHALRQVCSSGRWADAVLGGRPYASLAALLAASDAAVSTMSQSDLREALAGHPKLGAAGSQLSAWSAQEQAGIAGGEEAGRRALVAANGEYEQRFGHIYLACATGRDAGELLAFLRERLGNDPAAEWRVVAAELAKINQIRLCKLFGGDQ